MNFFEPACQEPTINESEFGLCDDQNGTKAYTNIGDRTKWIATVQNDRNKSLTFTAIDKCVLNDDEEPDKGRCDGMLISDSNEHIYFAELKNQAKNWIQNAINQLESTVQFFIENHDISVYKYKKAFACNKKHPHFQEIDNELNLRFFRTYGVRIDLQARIIFV
ncbi:MAG: hypothetical protein DRI57_06340 [Deltaproteobacteria bacterium]|nr:MAG: hypothetical protein DRI57_06340 [Deltaproteobacteria bacterium]